MSIQEKSIYSPSSTKQANVVAGVSGSFIHEIKSADIKDFKSWVKEWNDSDFTNGYDHCFGSQWTSKLDSCKNLKQVLNALIEMNLEANFYIHKELLNDLGVEADERYKADIRILTMNTNKGLFTIDCSSPTAPQFEKWCKENRI